MSRAAPGQAACRRRLAFEVKWDGYRLAIHIAGKRVRIITRGGHDWTPRFPTIAHDALELGVDSAILDGEAVVLDERVKRPAKLPPDRRPMLTP